MCIASFSPSRRRERRAGSGPARSPPDEPAPRPLPRRPCRCCTIARDSPPDPDDRCLFLLLRKAGLGNRDAYTFVQELQNMAAANLIARFVAELDALSDQLGYQLRRERAILGGLG